MYDVYDVLSLYDSTLPMVVECFYCILYSCTVCCIMSFTTSYALQYSCIAIFRRENHLMDSFFAFSLTLDDLQF